MKKFVYILVFSFTLVSFIVLMSYLFIFPIYQREKEIIIPNILYDTYDDAVLKLEEVGLKYEVNFIDCEIANDNKIVRTMPNVNKSVKKKSKIVLFLGRNNGVFKLNNYVNNSYEKIEKELDELKEKINLNIVKIYEKNDTYPNNTILNQVPSGNTVIDKNSVLVLYISSFEGKIYMPDFTNWTIDLLLSYQEENKLNFEFVYEDNNSIEKDKVIKQSILPNSVWYKNKSDVIKIYISNGKKEDTFPNLEGLDINVAIYILNFLGSEYELEYVWSNEEKNIVLEQTIKTGASKILILKVSK